MTIKMQWQKSRGYTGTKNWIHLEVTVTNKTTTDWKVLADFQDYLAEYLKEYTSNSIEIVGMPDQEDTQYTDSIAIEKDINDVTEQRKFIMKLAQEAKRKYQDRAKGREL